uniref:DUF4005 domain-containing protein n=1 Tax=Meloidogyne hapla TaxID=6305 RepID=A0A1I8BA72_MELHA
MTTNHHRYDSTIYAELEEDLNQLKWFECSVEEVESRSRRKNTRAISSAVTATTALNDGSFKSAKYSTLERERVDSISSNYSKINQLTIHHRMPIPKKSTVAAVSVRESQSSVQLSTFTSINTNHNRSDQHSRLCQFSEKDAPPVFYRSSGTRSLTHSESNLRCISRHTYI